VFASSATWTSSTSANRPSSAITIS
jgi:hypothetical protein